ncbi:flavin reductase family protein [Sciscionella marina]|uniref:flavin reductase family protein n=1 Tax=Sciscionella marina TaxID=508770 RepID=UPI00036B7B91|nr:flavin reductase family protein [Sciscionella marina]
MDTAAPAASVDPRRFRDAMGRFATGITIISTPTPAGPHCMTANGFMSVSLEPALVVVSIAKRAKMHDLLLASGVYGVSVLAADQESVSKHFSGRPDPDLAPRFEDHADVPLVPGALAQVGAEIVEARPVGDHTLFVGEVRHLADGVGEPLVFYAGRYRHLLSPSADSEYSDAWSGFCLTPFCPPSGA